MAKAEIIGRLIQYIERKQHFETYVIDLSHRGYIFPVEKNDALESEIKRSYCMEVPCRDTESKQHQQRQEQKQQPIKQQERSSSKSGKSKNNSCFNSNSSSSSSIGRSKSNRG